MAFEKTVLLGESFLNGMQRIGGADLLSAAQMKNYPLVLCFGIFNIVKIYFLIAEGGLQYGIFRF